MAMKKQSKKSSQAEGKKGLIEVRCGKIVIRAKKLVLRINSERRLTMTVYTVIKIVAKSTGKSIYRIEKELGFSNGTISKWNKSMPGADSLQAVADYLGTTSQYLLRLAKEDN